MDLFVTIKQKFKKKMKEKIQRMKNIFAWEVLCSIRLFILKMQTCIKNTRLEYK